MSVMNIHHRATSTLTDCIYCGTAHSKYSLCVSIHSSGEMFIFIFWFHDGVPSYRLSEMNTLFGYNKSKILHKACISLPAIYTQVWTHVLSCTFSDETIHMPSIMRKWLRCCGMSSKEPFTPVILRIWLSGSNSVMTESNIQTTERN